MPSDRLVHCWMVHRYREQRRFHVASLCSALGTKHLGRSRRLADWRKGLGAQRSGRRRRQVGSEALSAQVFCRRFCDVASALDKEAWRELTARKPGQRPESLWSPPAGSVSQRAQGSILESDDPHLPAGGGKLDRQSPQRFVQFWPARLPTLPISLLRKPRNGQRSSNQRTSRPSRLRSPSSATAWQQRGSGAPNKLPPFDATAPSDEFRPPDNRHRRCAAGQ